MRIGDPWIKGVEIMGVPFMPLQGATDDENARRGTIFIAGGNSGYQEQRQCLRGSRLSECRGGGR